MNYNGPIDRDQKRELGKIQSKHENSDFGNDVRGLIQFFRPVTFLRKARHLQVRVVVNKGMMKEERSLLRTALTLIIIILKVPTTDEWILRP